MKRGWGVVAIGLLLIAGACSQERPSDPQSTTGEVTLQVQGEVEEVAVYDALVKSFELDVEGIDVNLVKLTDEDDILAKLTAQFASGNAPDVFTINFREFSQFAAEGALEPAGPLLEAEGLDFGDYYPQPMQAFTYNDELQCMPQNLSSMVVFYNTQLFERFNVPRPQPGWTWEDFRDTAIALNKEGAHGLGIDPHVIRLAPFIWSNGGELVDDPENPSRFALDDPQSREAVEFIVSLVRDDGVVPSEKEVAAQALDERFAAGKLGMLLSSRREVPGFREVQGLQWDAAAPPVAKEPSSILHTDGYCIAAGSENVDAAAKFVAYAMSKEGQTITALSGRTVPVLKSVAHSAAFLDPAQPPAHSEVWLEVIPHLRATPVIPTWPEIEALSEETIIKMFYEPGFTIDDGIEELDRTTSDLFREGVERGLGGETGEG
ncbi:MAG TPA: sugar ABC transporter substrate-binding protein [Actinomycetota bacterium]|nr:sugar ABC transporter substrate-binding protein [Actinomycetota bacterium]